MRPSRYLFTPFMRWFCLLAVVLSCAAQANDEVNNSGYSPVVGEQFFLLSDSSFSSEEQARVRLEAPGRDYRRYNMEQYGGVDMRVYRLEKPLEFLKGQKNLHRILKEGNFKGEGISNTLAFLWDHWYSKSRRVMQRAFSYETRKQVTQEVPQLKMGEAIAAPTQYQVMPQFDPIPGVPMVAQFRYPLWEAKPIEPPKGVALAGSSSDFISVAPGNVYVPLGKLKPGLYLVEAIVGKYRATTVVFVSNTVAVTKIAGEELLVWTAHKTQEKSVANTKLLWTDGLGVLKQGNTDAQGLSRLAHTSPERSFVIGEDAEGGVFVAENFYYDSEIYDTKLYAFTDRPLYRPGDWVTFKVLGREFKNARDSVAPQMAPLTVVVLDANGTALQTLPLQYDSVSGTDGRFQLPENATAGGYELRLGYRDQQYSSAFRVADYIKPHFEISMTLSKADFKTAEPVTGTLALVYPDGRPVADARVQISLRAQQLSMVDNELQYLGQFPVELKTADLVADGDGKVALDLPAAEKPSRYLLTVFASDGAAYRVKTTKEILIERGATQYRLSSARNFTAANETVEFTIKAESRATNAPTQWEWVRLEDQSKETGSIESADGESSEHAFSVTFARPGTYTVNIRDTHDMLLGATGHAVSGDGVKSVPGTIEIVFDKREYSVGDVAEALVTFPEPVKEALLTLERDKVEATSLLSQPGAWLQAERLNDTQYRVRIPVETHFAPNLTFSVLYTKGNEYSFQNAGIRVPSPRIEIAVSTDKEVYQPGETVTVDLQTGLAGAAAPTRLTVSVVDEMIYALQPEIAPDIDAFFYHPRRNNVRTSASLSFISYDIALPASAMPPGQGNRSERGVKVLERPRREDIDTASWQPDLQTDAEGKAQFTFVMPDSLTRWRVTVRAINDAGVVGQRTHFMRSEKPLYLKWSGPKQFRHGDQPVMGLLAFNQSEQPIKAIFTAQLVTAQTTTAQTTTAQSSPHTQRNELELPRGVNYIPLDQIQAAAGTLQASLAIVDAAGNPQPTDALEITLQDQGEQWQAHYSKTLLLSGASTPLELPADARNVQVRLDNQPQALFLSALDDLLEYPWGCVEQTASRLLPLSLAYPMLAEQADPRVRDRLRLVIQNSRLRLVQMAGPNAMFSWWGEEGGENAFLTGYAYYADWYASRALNVSLPEDHWQRVLNLYSLQAEITPLLHRALILSFAREMGLPIETLLKGLAESLQKAGPGEAVDVEASGDTSLVFMAPESKLGLAAARVLTSTLAARSGVSLSAEFTQSLSEAEQVLASSTLPFAQGLRLYAGAADAAQVVALFQQLTPNHATLERALLLTWLRRHLLETGQGEAPTLARDWKSTQGLAGSQYWLWQAAALPTTLELGGVPAQPVVATITWQGNDASAKDAPVTIKRKLWKLQSGAQPLSYNVEAVTSNEVASNALYLDEIVISTTATKPLRYGLLEIPLPPGADVERTTWGLMISGLGGTEAMPLEKARHEPGQLSYAVPVDSLQGEIRLRHLVRFSQKGRFSLPPARYMPMYAPRQQAYEANPPLSTLMVE